MADVIPVPTLSTFGYVRTPAEKIDFLLAHFFYSDKLQTAIYGDKVASFQWIIEEKAGSMVDTCRKVQQDLSAYLRRYYQTTDVSVKFEDEDPKKSSTRVRMLINATVTENGIRYSVSKLVRIIDGKFKEFMDINNTTG